jgi:ribokinase
LKQDQPKLVVAGNACLDVTYHLDRLPKPGETLIAQKVVTDLGGKGLNQAIAAQRAEASVLLIAAIGNDAAGEKIRAALLAEGMETHGLITHDGASDDSLLLLDRKGENVIVSNTLQAQSLTPTKVTAALRYVLEGADLLLLQGNLSEKTTRHAISMAQQAGVRIAVNPSPFQAWFKNLPTVDLIIANQVEADALSVSGSILSVVTLGGKGCRLKSGSHPEILIPAPKVQAIAAGGAGDVFAGTFIAEWLASGEAEQAARLAVLAASDKATRHGTLSAFPDRSSIEAFRRGLPRRSR